jgi:hypothetical protein
VVTFLERRTIANIAIARELVGCAGPWPSWTNSPTIRFADPGPGGGAWSDPRNFYEQHPALSKQ